MMQIQMDSCCLCLFRQQCLPPPEEQQHEEEQQQLKEEEAMKNKPNYAPCIWLDLKQPGHNN